MWNPRDYLQFSAERSRPFNDLLAQVPDIDAKFIADLGCGPGTMTHTLAERWPNAHIVGVDISAEMLALATQLAIPNRLEFVQSDIASWSSQQPLDLLVSNAALQWIGDHRHVLVRLAGMLAPNGYLAVQMPHRFQTPMQTAIEETVSEPRLAGVLKGIGLHRESVMEPTWYATRLHEQGFAVNAWETTYIHVLQGENPVLEWLKGTALRPLLKALGESETAPFLTALGSRLKTAYPPTGKVTLLPMPRLFFVATR